MLEEVVLGVSQEVAVGVSEEVVVGVSQEVVVGVLEKVAVGVSREVVVGVSEKVAVGVSRWCTVCLHKCDRWWWMCHSEVAVGGWCTEPGQQLFLKA